LNNTSNTNSSSNTATSGTSNATASSSSTPTFSPQLQALMNSLSSYSTESMTDPMATLKPVEDAGLQAINQSYAGAPGQVAQQMASRGYGSSGTAGDAEYTAALARSGSVAGLQGTLATDATQIQENGANLGEQLLNTGKGTSSTGTSSGTTSGSSSTAGNSTTTQSGLGSILSSLSSLLLLGGDSSGDSSPGSTGTLANSSQTPSQILNSTAPNWNLGATGAATASPGGFDDGGMT